MDINEKTTYGEEFSKPIVHRVGRRIYFFSEVDPASICEAIKYIDQLERESKKPIEFFINSSGGYCYQGLALYDRLRRCPCDIYMIATGFVASMGFVIYLAGDVRYMTENCVLMNHQASIDITGKVSDVKIETKEIVNLEEQISCIIADRTGKSLKKVKAEVKPGDCYIRAKEALEKGYAHKTILNKKCRSAKG